MDVEDVPVGLVLMTEKAYRAMLAANGVGQGEIDAILGILMGEPDVEAEE